MCVSIALTLVLPCVPPIATTQENMPAISARNSCRSIVFMPFSLALFSSGWEAAIADENTTKSALSAFCASAPIVTEMPSD